MFGSKIRQRPHRSTTQKPVRTDAVHGTISPTASTVSASTLSDRSVSYNVSTNRLSSSDDHSLSMEQLRISDNDTPVNELQAAASSTTSTAHTHNRTRSQLTTSIGGNSGVSIDLNVSYEHNAALHECMSDAYHNTHPQWSQNCVHRGDNWLRVLRPERLRKRFIAGTYAKLARQYEKLNDHPIRKDLSRTYPTHPLFIGAQLDDSVEIHNDTDVHGAGRPMLYNLLRAYAAYDVDIGYSQGLAFIAAFLVMHIPNDELAFYSLVILMLNQQFNIRWLYESDCYNLTIMFTAFERMMSLHTPRAYKHLQQQSVHPSMFATQWFLTLFCYRVSYSFTAALWDSIILDSQYTTYEGRNRRVVTASSGYLLVRLLQTATAVMKYYENHLCTVEFDTLVPFLSNPPSLDISLVKLSTTLLVPPSVQTLLQSALQLSTNVSPHTKIRNRLQQSTLNRRRSNRKSYGGRSVLQSSPNSFPQPSAVA